MSCCDRYSEFSTRQKRKQYTKRIYECSLNRRMCAQAWFSFLSHCFELTLVLFFLLIFYSRSCYERTFKPIYIHTSPPRNTQWNTANTRDTSIILKSTCEVTFNLCAWGERKQWFMSDHRLLYALYESMYLPPMMYIVHVVAFIVAACQTTLNLLFRCLLVFACICVEGGGGFDIGIVAQQLCAKCSCRNRTRTHTTESQCITIEMRTRMQSESTTDMEYWLKFTPGFVQKKQCNLVTNVPWAMNTRTCSFWELIGFKNLHKSTDERNIMNCCCSFWVSKFGSPNKPNNTDGLHQKINHIPKRVL